MEYKPRIQKFIIVLLLAMAPSLRAQLFNPMYLTTRSMGLGGVEVTGFDDPSCVISNPAALTKIEQNVFSAELAASQPSVKVTSPGSPDVDSDNNLNFSPFAGVVYSLGSRLVGVGITASVIDNYHISYPSTGPQRYQVTDFAFRTAALDVAIGYVPVRNLSIGLRVGYFANASQWERMSSPFGDTPDSLTKYDVRWKYSFYDWGGIRIAGGLIWSPSYRFDVGITYQPPLTYHLKTDADIYPPEILGGGKFHPDMGNVGLRMPQEARIGFHWVASERIDFYLDAKWTNSSRIKDIDLTVKKTHEPIVPGKLVVPSDYKDTWRINSGIEILVTNSLTLRLGGNYRSRLGNAQFESSLLPLESFWSLTTGLSYKLTRLTVDLAAGHTFYNDHEITGTELPFPLSGKMKADENTIRIGFKWLF